MTIQNYSIIGLKDLLNDLENLSTCLMTIPQEHVDSTAYCLLQEDQFNLIQTINGYASMLCAFNLGDLPD
jgi:protein involved in sex pheromone biosynthesis